MLGPGAMAAYRRHGQRGDGAGSCSPPERRLLAEARDVASARRRDGLSAVHWQAVPASFGAVPAGHGRQQNEPPGFRSGLQSCVPLLGQGCPPITHWPPAATQAAGPLESPFEPEQAHEPTAIANISATIFMGCSREQVRRQAERPIPRAFRIQNRRSRLRMSSVGG